MSVAVFQQNSIYKDRQKAGFIHWILVCQPLCKSNLCTLQVREKKILEDWEFPIHWMVHSKDRSQT